MKDNILNRKFKFAEWNSVYYIIVLNVAVFFAINYLNISIRRIPLQYYLSLIPVFVKHGYVWQFVTYMFVHPSFSHLFFNMYALLVFGLVVEKYIGSKEFLLFYFLTGILSGIMNFLIAPVFGGANFATVGASGAIYGILFLMAVMFPYNRILLFFVIPMRMPVAVFVFIIIEIVSQITGTAADIAHLVHLSGITFAWIYCVVRFRISPWKVFKETSF